MPSKGYRGTPGGTRSREPYITEQEMACVSVCEERFGGLATEADEN